MEVDEDTERRYLFFDGGAFDLMGQMTFLGMPQAPRPTGGSNDPIFLSSPQPYLCTETTLTYYADDPLGPVWLTRTSEPVEVP